jgi:hypothetical protein
MTYSARFADFLNVMLPGGGLAVAITQVFIDESYDDKQPPILCVAGYVYRKMRAVEFGREWGQYLRLKELPYFHMSECAHRDGIFKGRSDTVAIAKRLIELTRSKTAYGFAVTVDEEAYARVVQPREGMPSAYAFALKSCIGMVKNWKERSHATGPTSFFFEEGHKHQKDANNFLSWLFSSEEIKAKYGYAGHAFVPKETPAMHPADFLAWNSRLEAKRQYDPLRRPPRKDLLAVLRDHDQVRDYKLADLIRLEAALKDLEVKRHRTRDEMQAALRAAAFNPVGIGPAVEASSEGGD